MLDQSSATKSAATDPSEPLVERRHFRPWLAKGDDILLAALIALHLMPVWWFRYFPSQDGPDYLQNAEIIRRYDDPDFTLVRDYYLINRKLSPHWAIHLLLAGLMEMVPALVAEKLLLSGYVILLPLSLRYTLVGFDPRTKFLTVFALPITYNSLFHFGLHGFSYSLVLFLFVVGYWLRHRHHFTTIEAIRFSVLTTLLYFAHPTSFVMAAVAVLVLFAWTIAFDAVTLDKTSLGSALRARRTTIISTVCALIPAFVLLAIFLFEQGTGHLPAWPIKRLLTAMLYLSLISFSATDGRLALAFSTFFGMVLACAGFSRLRRPRLMYSDGLLALGLVYLCVYLTAPRFLAGGSLIDLRLIFYPFFAFTLWLAGATFRWPARLAVQLGAATLALAMLSSHATKYREINGYLEQYLSGMQLLEPNKTLLPLCLWQRSLPDGQMVSAVVSPFVHASGYIGAQKPIVVLDNHGADTTHFPIAYRPERSPYHHIGRAIGKGTPSYESTLEREPPEVDFLTYSKRTGGRVDYVLVWGGNEMSRFDARTAPIYAQLEEGFELIHESPGRGLMQLYRTKVLGREASSPRPPKTSLE